MTIKKDYSSLIGQRFGKLVVLSVGEWSSRNKQLAKVTCDCGNSTYTLIYNLLSGNSRSCGCVKGKSLSAEERLMRSISIDPATGCWLWTGLLFKDGYGKMRYENERRAHRISYKLFKGDIPTGMLVCHSCDVHNCVNPDHLFIGTTKDNAVDMAKKGRAPSMKLSEDDVHTIRKLLANGVPGGIIARQYNMSPRSIRRIKAGKSWSWLD